MREPDHVRPTSANTRALDAFIHRGQSTLAWARVSPFYFPEQSCRSVDRIRLSLSLSPIPLHDSTCRSRLSMTGKSKVGCQLKMPQVY